MYLEVSADKQVGIEYREVAIELGRQYLKRCCPLLE
jgi:hypothetical protein